MYIISFLALQETAGHTWSKTVTTMSGSFTHATCIATSARSASV